MTRADHRAPAVDNQAAPNCPTPAASGLSPRPGSATLAALEWLARLVEGLGWGRDAVEGAMYYEDACALYGANPRELAIRDEDDDADDSTVRARVDAALKPAKETA